MADFWGLVRSDGALDRPVNDSWLVPPRIEVVENRLVWSPETEEISDWGFSWDMVRPAPGLLADFIRLADARDERILQYARRWGVLGICVHGFPSGHKQPLGGDEADDIKWGLWGADWPRLDRCGEFLRSPQAGDEPVFWEPLDAWRHYARHALAILNIAARLKEGHAGRPEDVKILETGFSTGMAEREVPGRRFLSDSWEISPIRVVEETAEFSVREDFLMEFERHGGVQDSERDIGTDKTIIRFCVNKWLEMGNVMPVLSWSDDPKVTFGGDGLFAALGMQILLSINSADALDICSNCGLPYPPVRRPRADGRHYCADCGKRAAWRDAAREYRRRQGRKPDAPVRSSEAEGHNGNGNGA